MQKKNRKTDRQTNTGKNLTPATAVGVGKYSLHASSFANVLSKKSSFEVIFSPSMS